MDIRRKVLIGLALLCVLSGTVAIGAPMQCQPGTLATYTAPAFACTEGGGLFTLKSFYAIVPQGGLTLDQIIFNPIDGPGQIGGQVVGTFTANPGQTLTYEFGFYIDPPPIIHGEEIDLDPTGAVTLQTVLCAVNTVPCPNANILSTLMATTASPTASAPLGNLSTLSVQNTFGLDGGRTGATSGGFNNITIVLPEPAAILLTAAGLLGLFAFRSRLKLR
jgi:hypothetical protein